MQNTKSKSASGGEVDAALAAFAVLKEQHVATARAILALQDALGGNDDAICFMAGIFGHAGRD